MSDPSMGQSDSGFIEPQQSTSRETPVTSIQQSAKRMRDERWVVSDFVAKLGKVRVPAHLGKFAQKTQTLRKSRSEVFTFGN